MNDNMQADWEATKAAINRDVLKSLGITWEPSRAEMWLVDMVNLLEEDLSEGCIDQAEFNERFAVLQRCGRR